MFRGVTAAGQRGVAAPLQTLQFQPGDNRGGKRQKPAAASSSTVAAAVPAPPTAMEDSRLPIDASPRGLSASLTLPPPAGDQSGTATG